jgi:multidrug efflux system membrane fusion protein
VTAKLLYAFGIVVPVVLMLSGCNKKNAYVPPPPEKIAIATPLEAPVTLYAEFTGTTAAVSSVDLEARVEGFVSKVGFKDGAVVKKDQMLFEIEPDQYQADVDLQKANLASAVAQQANVQREFYRQSTLGQTGVTSRQKVDQAKTDLETANAEVAADLAKRKLAEVSLSYTIVQAPFDGIVTRHLVDVGSLVGSSGPTKLTTILQVQPLDVYFNLSEQDARFVRTALAETGTTLEQIRNGQKPLAIQIATEGGKTFSYTGVVDYISPQIDPDMGTLQMRGVLPNKNIALVPGQFIRVRLPIGMIKKAILVNDTAVMSNQIGDYVLVVDNKNVVALRQVTAGPVEGQLRVITDGLSATDKVVIGSIQHAVPGRTVDPVISRMAAPPDKPIPAPDALLQ